PPDGHGVSTSLPPAWRAMASVIARPSPLPSLDGWRRKRRVSWLSSLASAGEHAPYAQPRPGRHTGHFLSGRARPCAGEAGSARRGGHGAHYGWPGTLNSLGAGASAAFICVAGRYDGRRVRSPAALSEPDREPTLYGCD